VLCAVGCLAIFALYVNFDNLVGAFGNGPPYYARSTNMDKWGNPIPFLIAFDAVAGLIAVLLGRWSWRVLRR
jgi:hypothetical protein